MTHVSDNPRTKTERTARGARACDRHRGVQHGATGSQIASAISTAVAGIRGVLLGLTELTPWCTVVARRMPLIGP